NDALYLLIKSVMAPLPEDARILIVGVGTGTEIIELAHQFPNWKFTALDPSELMIEVCREKIIAAQLHERCEFRVGFLEDHPSDQRYDGAMALLVSQFMTDQIQRTAFFRDIASRLNPKGIFVNADLTGDPRTEA